MAITRRSPSHAPGVPAPASGPGHPRVEFADRFGAQAGAGLAQCRGGRHLPPLVPGPQKSHTIDEFAHHLFVGVLEEQRHRQHEVHDDPGRQQATAPLGAAGVGEHFVDQIAVHQPGQHTQTDPVGQPIPTTVFTTGTPIGHNN
jgi:hypothetical protein